MGGGGIEDTKNSFVVKLSDLKESNFWTPKHFSPYYRKAIDIVKKKHTILKLKDIAIFKKGDEVGSENYIDFFDKNDTDIPFLRTGDLVNFSVNQTPDKFIDKQIYIELGQDLQPKDILFTKDGKTGMTAMITENDKVVISSGILKIRLKQDAIKNYGITPEYLFAILSNNWTGYFQALRNTVIAATISHLNEKRIENFDIPVLDKKTIDNITDIVQKSFELKNESSRLDKKATNLLKDGLIK